MSDKKKWFIRVTTIDKANGPVHHMATTHSTYSQAAMHLVGTIGAERIPMGKEAIYTKGKVRFDILPISKKEKVMEKNESRTTPLINLQENIVRTRQQILEAAEEKSKDKKDDKKKDKPSGLKKPSVFAKKKDEDESKDNQQPPQKDAAPVGFPPKKKAPDEIDPKDLVPKGNKTLTGEKPNKIEMNPELESSKASGVQRPVIEPSPNFHVSR